MLDRLGTLQRITLIENEQRHAADPVLAGKAQVPGDLSFTEASGQACHELRAIERDLRTLEQIDNLGEVTHVDALFEVTTKQSVDGAHALTLAAGKANHSL